MSGFASKNLYELLGNDPDQDPDAPQPPPVQPVDKAVARSGKRNAPAEAPVSLPSTTTEAPRGGRGGRGRGRGRGDFAGNEGAFRDRDAGRSSNRDRPVEDGVREDRQSNRLGGDRPRREFGENYNGRGERRGGREFRGGRGGRGPRDDRHSRGVTSDPNDHAKQAGHGWGEATGAGEWGDEQAGQAIANADEKDVTQDAGPVVPTNAEGEHPSEGFSVPPALEEEPAPQAAREPEPEPEPEDKSKSYATYLAELAEKKLALGGGLTVRQANEGSDKKLEGKAITRDDSNDAYMSGSAGKARRERERKDKNLFTIDHDIQAREQTGGFRGEGRGRGRGGRARGEGGFRGEGRGRGGRGGFRGESRLDFRGEPRSRGGASSSPNVTNETDFPTLGGK